MLLHICVLYSHIPGQDFVEQYIKAYYLSEHDIVKWIEDHKVSSVECNKGIVTSIRKQWYTLFRIRY